MKKLFSVMIVMAVCIHLTAQNKKGNWLVGVDFGSTGISFGNSESTYGGSPTVSKTKNHGFNLSINPNLGYYVNDKTVIGGDIRLSPSSYKYDYSNGGTNTASSKSSYFYVGIGPYLREYLGTLNNKSMPFIQAMAGIYFYPGYKYTYTPATGTGAYTEKYDKYNSFMAGIEFGCEHYLNNIIGLQYSLGYQYWHYNENYTIHYISGGYPDNTGTYKSSSNNISVEVGLEVHLQSLHKK